MPSSRADISDWLESPLGESLRAAELALVREALSRIFGFQLLQIGAWGADEFIAHARTSRAAVLAGSARPGVAMLCDPVKLGVGGGSVDAVLLPHTLEMEPDPHEVLREVDRVLVGDGELVVLGFNPYGPWGLARALRRGRFPPGIERMIPERRLRDWLALLGFDVGAVQHYYYRPPLRSGSLIQRFAGLDKTGARFWPGLAAGYMLGARKRVIPLTPIRPLWRRTPAVVGGLVEPSTRSCP